MNRTVLGFHLTTLEVHCLEKKKKNEIYAFPTFFYFEPKIFPFVKYPTKDVKFQLFGSSAI